MNIENLLEFLNASFFYKIPKQNCLEITVRVKRYRYKQKNTSITVSDKISVTLFAHNYKTRNPNRIDFKY